MLKHPGEPSDELGLAELGIAYAGGFSWNMPAAAAAAAAAAVNVYATGNPDIDGVLSGLAWSGTVTYSFPDSPSDYPTGSYQEPRHQGFAQISLNQQHIVDTTMAMIEGYTNIDIAFAGTGSADIMLAQSPVANPTSYAYYPSAYPQGGDVWFGTAYNYAGAKLGDYAYDTVMHEIGHAFGLKHSQEAGGPANVAVPFEHDALEYSIMSYRSYEGGSTTQGYTNENFGFPQTFMMNDILALQTMYGANYNTHSEDTVYSWSPTTGEMVINGVGQGRPGGPSAGPNADRIFLTIWDGGGNDTYDMSNYIDNVSIDLRPGYYSTTSAVQLAYLGDGQYAHGNIYNAYLFNDDPRSYIENAIGGAGNDVLVGNEVANWLDGNDGSDVVVGGNGNNLLFGGSGSDVVIGGAGNDYIDGGQSNDLLGSWSGADTFKFGANFGNDWVGGFTAGEDKIDLAGLGLEFSNIMLSPYGDGTIVVTPEGSMLVAHATLHNSDFVF